ncbi:hypothetical protein A55_1934 [Vibrio cholerae 1587]|nr:hypothetical protein A55_1934 [Vibrio cholerae 1587]
MKLQQIKSLSKPWLAWFTSAKDGNYQKRVVLFIRAVLMAQHPMFNLFLSTALTYQQHGRL